MQVEVVLKSPAPVKPKQSDKSQAKHAPVADRDSDDELVNEPKRKRKARDVVDDRSTKQQRSTTGRLRQSGRIPSQSAQFVQK
ncbi:unnamed protein product, partial [Rhizoctonia solani]